MTASPPIAPAPRSAAARAVSALLAIVAGAALLIVLGLLALIVFVRMRGPQADPSRGGLIPGVVAPQIAAGGWINGEFDAKPDTVTVVQGWFVDCPFCWREAPEIAALHDRYGDAVQFVSLTLDSADQMPRIKEFIEKGGITYPVGYDAMPTLAAFEAQYFPAVWVIGRDGKIVWNKGMEPQQSLEDAIRAAQAAPAAREVASLNERSANF